MSSREPVAQPGAFPYGPAAAFVLIWSAGYIAGPAGVDAVGPFRLLAGRFVLAAAVLATLAWWRHGRPRMDRATALRVALVGLAMNALQFGLMYLAFQRGLGATLGALLHSLSPVLTVVLAGVLLRERVRVVQVVGLVIGVVGVLLVLGPDVTAAGGPLAILLGLGSMLALSLGTMGQRWIPADVDPWWSATLQFTVSIPPLAVLAVTEWSDPVVSVWKGAASLGFLALVNSIVGLLLLGTLVRRGGAGTSASVFFLMPPVTAVLAYLLLGDTLNARELLGIAVAIVGVALGTVRLTRRRQPGRAPEPVRDRVAR